MKINKKACISVFSNANVTVNVFAFRSELLELMQV